MTSLSRKKILRNAISRNFLLFPFNYQLISTFLFFQLFPGNLENEDEALAWLVQATVDQPAPEALNLKKPEVPKEEPKPAPKKPKETPAEPASKPKVPEAKPKEPEVKPKEPVKKPVKAEEPKVRSTKCGNFRILLSLRFYVKPILEKQEVLKLQLLPF